MTVAELIRHLQDLDETLVVKVRVSVGDDTTDSGNYTLDDFLGEYCEITDEKNISVEYGDAVIIADWVPE